MQGSRSVLSWVPGWLRGVEHHRRVRVGRRADDHAAQPAAAVPPSGLPGSVSALPAVGRQHRVRIRQVSVGENDTSEIYVSV